MTDKKLCDCNQGRLPCTCVAAEPGTQETLGMIGNSDYIIKGSALQPNPVYAGNTLEFVKPGRPWAVLNADGKLEMFDAEAFKEATENGDSMARVFAAVLDHEIAQLRQQLEHWSGLAIDRGDKLVAARLKIIELEEARGAVPVDQTGQVPAGYVLNIEVEKLLCQALGREWSATGISIISLINELTAKAGQVPTKITDAMNAAGLKADREFHRCAADRIDCIFSAMLAAAPQPQGHADDE